MSNLISKYKKFHPLVKASVWIWLLTFILLIVFVCFALVQQQSIEDKTVHQTLWVNLLTTSGIFFITSLFAGLLTTAIPQVMKKNKGNK